MRLFLSCCNGRLSCFTSTEKSSQKKQQGTQSIHSTPSPYDVKDNAQEEGDVHDGYNYDDGESWKLQTCTKLIFLLVRGTVPCYPNIWHSTRNFVHTGGGDSIDIRR